MAEKDYIDITPTGVHDGKGRGVKGLKTTVFQNTEIRQIEENPERLTEEGIKKKIELWKHSNNSHCLIKYQTMLKRCKNIAKSGKTTENETILSRDEDGNPKWIDRIQKDNRPKEAKGKKE